MIQISTEPVKKVYDLEDRTLLFAKNVRNFINSLPKSLTNVDDCKQLIRSSGSVGANYREANDGLSKKDFLNRIKICRKEAKETVYWLILLESSSGNSHSIWQDLIKEAQEIEKIFGAIYRKFTDSF